jgi:hypothetical protein
MGDVDTIRAQVEDVVETLRHVLTSLEDNSSPLRRVAMNYGEDADAAYRRSVRHVVAASASFIVTGLVALAPMAWANGYEKLGAAGLLVLILAMAGFFVLGLTLLRASQRHRRHAAEAERMRRLVQTLACYASDESDSDYRLMRLALLQRLFPRSYETTDPLAESEWLTGEDVRKMWNSLIKDQAAT